MDKASVVAPPACTFGRGCDSGGSRPLGFWISAERNFSSASSRVEGTEAYQAALCVLRGDVGSSSTLSEEAIERVSAPGRLGEQAELEQSVSSEGCSLSLGGGTNVFGGLGCRFERLGRFFQSQQQLNGLANLEGVISAKARRWQNYQAWWRKRKPRWLSEVISEFQTCEDEVGSDALELSKGRDGGHDLLGSGCLGKLEAIDNADCASQQEFTGDGHLDDNDAAKWKNFSDDGLESNILLPMSGRGQKPGLLSKPGCLGTEVVPVEDLLICTTAREADLSSSIVEVSSSSFGGGQVYEDMGRSPSPQSGNKAVTSRMQLFLSDPTSIDMEDAVDSSVPGILLDMQSMWHGKKTACESEVAFTRRKRACRRRRSDGSGLCSHLVSNETQAGNWKSKSPEIIDAAWCQDSNHGRKRKVDINLKPQYQVDISACHGQDSQSYSKRKHLPENISAHPHLAGVRCKETSRLSDSKQDPGTNGNFRSKTRTMIRALQVQRGGTKIVDMCLKRKRNGRLKGPIIGELSSFGGHLSGLRAEGHLDVSPSSKKHPDLTSEPKAVASGFLKKQVSVPHGSQATSQVECFYCQGSLSSGEVVSCNNNGCGRVYHYSCARPVDGFSWRRNKKLICPHHACVSCRKVRQSRLWRCERCPVAFHENCCPSPQKTKLLQTRPGWAVCWRHSGDWKLANKFKVLTGDIKEVFCRLPLPDVVEDFKITSSFWKEVMENDREPPPYTHIRRNVYMIKKKRDDFDDGVSCTCHQDNSQICGDDCECRVQSMSCSKFCKCTDRCTNKPFRKEKRVKVVKTEHCGWGAEAIEGIKEGQFIIEYTGEVIDDAICEQRLWAMKGRSVHNFYMCEIAKDFIIDATFKGNASRYLNHSCQPNCKLEKWRVDGETRVGVFALKDIAVGEPLTYNYKFIDYGMNVTCRCGAPNCRGAIGEKFGSNVNKAKGVIEHILVWGVKQKRSCLPTRLEEHIRFVVRKRKNRQTAKGS